MRCLHIASVAKLHNVIRTLLMLWWWNKRKHINFPSVCTLEHAKCTLSVHSYSRWLVRFVHVILKPKPQPKRFWSFDLLTSAHAKWLPVNEVHTREITFNMLGSRQFWTPRLSRTTSPHYSLIFSCDDDDGGAIGCGCVCVTLIFALNKPFDKCAFSHHFYVRAAEANVTEKCTNVRVRLTPF